MRPNLPVSRAYLPNFSHFQAHLFLGREGRGGSVLLRPEQYPQNQYIIRHDGTPDILPETGPTLPVAAVQTKGPFQPGDVGFDAGPEVPQLLVNPQAFHHLQHPQASPLGEHDIFNPLAFGQPEVFWGDLAEILRLQVTTGAAEFEAQAGHYVADRLPPFIARVKKLLQASGGRPGWDADARGTALVVLANALSTLGEQSGQNKPLEEAVAAYREALKEFTRERAPLKWATTQNNLGNALASLGERESGTKRLEEAVAAYKAALEVVEPTQATYYVKMVKGNLRRAEARLKESQK
jgi:tetratricopeptide (TPR) repeat protein